MKMKIKIYKNKCIDIELRQKLHNIIFLNLSEMKLFWMHLTFILICLLTSFNNER